MPPKARTITDMPVHIFEKICSNLGDDYQQKYRFIFRHVCKSFRSLADSWTPKFDNISIDSELFQGIVVEFDNTKCEYRRFLSPFLKQKHHDVALDDLISVLKFPNFKFETLELGQKWIIDKRFLEKFLLKIKSSNLKIHATTVALNFSDHEIDILKFCENPEYVKISNSVKAPIEEIFSKLDKLGYSIFNKDEQSKQPKLILKYRKLIASEATEIVKTLLQYHNLKYCHLVGPFGMRTFKRNIFKFGAQSVPAYQGHILHFPIPDSLDFFEIDCHEFIKIEKKTFAIQ